jgi:hypothetical protein
MTGSVRNPLRPRKGALHRFYLIYPSICILLVTDVLANHFFIPTHCGHEISPCPEVLPDEIALPLRIPPRNVNRTDPRMDSSISRRVWLCWRRSGLIDGSTMKAIQAQTRFGGR